MHKKSDFIGIDGPINDTFYGLAKVL